MYILYHIYNYVLYDIVCVKVCIYVCRGWIQTENCVKGWIQTQEEVHLGLSENGVLPNLLVHNFPNMAIWGYPPFPGKTWQNHLFMLLRAKIQPDQFCGCLKMVSTLQMALCIMGMMGKNKRNQRTRMQSCKNTFVKQVSEQSCTFYHFFPVTVPVHCGKWKEWECQVWSVKKVECWVGNVVCRVWSWDCGVWSLKCGVWGGKCEV